MSQHQQLCRELTESSLTYLLVYDLYVHVRAFGNAAILATPSPTVDFPCFKIVFNGPHGNTRMTVREYQGASELVLEELQLDDVVDYWAWHEFSISFFANSVQVSANCSRFFGKYLLRST